MVEVAHDRLIFDDSRNECPMDIQERKPRRGRVRKAGHLTNLEKKVETTTEICRCKQLQLKERGLTEMNKCSFCDSKNQMSCGHLTE